MGRDDFVTGLSILVEPPIHPPTEEGPVLMAARNVGHRGPALVYDVIPPAHLLHPARPAGPNSNIEIRRHSRTSTGKPAPATMRTARGFPLISAQGLHAKSSDNNAQMQKSQQEEGVRWGGRVHTIGSSPKKTRSRAAYRRELPT